MNKRECVLALQTVLAILLGICLSFATSATSTTPASTTGGATVSNSSTVSASSTSTEPSTTTTTTTTTDPASGTSSTNVNVVGQCPCDVTGNTCDVNCCCDEDCSDTDRQASLCQPFSKLQEDRVCFPEELFLFENSDPVRSETTEDGLLCIYSDDSTEENQYTQPDVVGTLDTFRDYQQQFSSTSFQAPGLSAAILNASVYQSGDPIYTVMNTEALGMLGLPRHLTSMDCVDGNPAAYLSDETFSCVRNVDDLNSECITSPALDAHTFFTGFRVVTSPQMFQALNITLNDTDPGFSLYNSDYTVAVKLDNRSGVEPLQCLDSDTGLISPCSFTTLPSPSLQALLCSNILSQVVYSIVTDGSAGIREVWARFVLTSLSSTGTVHFTQTFSAAFVSVRSADSYQRSGNPGYVLGQPLLAGTLNQTTDASGTTIDRIEVNEDRQKYMTLVKSSGSGDCVSGAEDRIPVLFGQDVHTGCLLRVRADNLTQYCTLMQESIVNTLELDSVPQATDTGYLDNNRYVGLYGNSDVSKTGDWVKILYQNRPLPSPPRAQTSSCQLSLGMQIQVMYANIGALVNPQPKVITVVFIYDDPTDLQVKVSGSGQFSQAVPISTSVSFLNVSKAALTYDPQPSIFQPKVPGDFFYPFITGTAIQCQPVWTFLMLSVSAVVALFL